MTVLSRRRPVARPIAASVAAAAASMTWLATPAHAEGAASCQATGGVYVYIGSASGGGCSHAGGTGMNVLRSLTSVQTNASGLICQIGGSPATCPDNPGNIYWAYWWWTGSAWTYATKGAAQHATTPGEVEAWTYGSGVRPSWTPPAASRPTSATTTTATATTRPTARVTTTVTTTQTTRATATSTRATTTRTTTRPSATTTSRAETSTAPSNRASTTSTSVSTGSAAAPGATATSTQRATATPATTGSSASSPASAASTGSSATPSSTSSTVIATPTTAGTTSGNGTAKQVVIGGCLAAGLAGGIAWSMWRRRR